MNKLILIGASVAALVAVPILAEPGDWRAHAGREVTRAEVETGVRTAFARVDADGDGFVTRSESDAFRAAAQEKREAHRREHRKKRFARLDSNRDGVINEAEFYASQAGRGFDNGERRVERFAKRRARQEGRQGEHGAMGMGMHFGERVFERMDADRDGRVSLAEATALGVERFDRTDANRDGRITREERQQARSARRPQG